MPDTKPIGEMNHLELIQALRKYLPRNTYRMAIDNKETAHLRKLLAYYEQEEKTGNDAK